MSETTTGTIAGYFEDHADAARAVDALRNAGFTSAHLGVAYRGSESAISGNTESSSYTAGNTAGQKTEGVWNKVKNFFEGNDVDADTYKRSHEEVGNREISPASRTGGVDYDQTEYGSSPYNHSDFEGSMQGLSIPEDRSRYFAHRFGNSDKGAVVTVNAAGREAEAKSILQQYGADLGEQASSYDYSSNRGTEGNVGTTQGTQNIQLLGEVLRVQKERINRGEVRFRKEVITDMQTVQVPVTREELVIERHEVGGTQPASGSIGENNEVRIPLTEERATLDKSTVVREEVSVGKRAIEDVRELKGDVRREELVVDDETRSGDNRTDKNRVA